jgi:SOS response regulatory protein OraA/RecX
VTDLSARRRKTVVEPPDANAAMEIAVGYLGTRPRTRWETARRLRRAGTQEPVIDEILERLGALGYLDDAAFARWWGEQRDRHAPRGVRMIEAELRQHGVPRDVIEAYRAEHRAPERRPEDESVPATEAERAADALARHLRGRPLPSDRKALQRVGMYLVRSAIREAGTEPTDDLP